MAITEQSRKELYQRLEDVLGDEPAATLMEHLPTTGWRDVATKDDLAQLEERLTLRFDRDLARVESSLNERMSLLDRFGEMDRRFGEMDTRFGQRFDDIDRRVDDIDRRFDDMERRFGQRLDEMERRFGHRFDEMNERFLGKAEFYKTITAQTIALVAFMAALITRMGG